jgi:hypothetical protein
MNFLEMYDFTVLILRVRSLIYTYQCSFKVANAVSLMPIKKKQIKNELFLESASEDSDEFINMINVMYYY